MSTTTDKPTIETGPEMSVWAITERQKFRKASNLKSLPYIADIDFLLAEVQRLQDSLDARDEEEAGDDR